MGQQLQKIQQLCGNPKDAWEIWKNSDIEIKYKLPIESFIFDSAALHYLPHPMLILCSLPYVNSIFIFQGIVYDAMYINLCI